MLKVHVQRFGNVAVLCLRGGIGIGETAALCTAVQALTDIRMVVLDFGKVNRIDAAGLALLLELRAFTQVNHIAFKFMNVTRLVRHVFEITCLNTVFEIISEAELMAAETPKRTGTSFKLVACAQ